LAPHSPLKKLILPDGKSCVKSAELVINIIPATLFEQQRLRPSPGNRKLIGTFSYFTRKEEEVTLREFI